MVILLRSYDGQLLTRLVLILSLCLKSGACGAVAKRYDASDIATARDPCDFQTIDVTSLTAGEFGERYRKAGQPVVLSNVGRTWPARKRWMQSDMIGRYGNKAVHSQHVRVLYPGWQGNESVETVLLRSPGNISVLLRDGYNSLVNDTREDFDVPPVFKHLLGEGPILSVGNKHSTIAMHQHTESWLAQVQGRKLWVLAPPGTDLKLWRSSNVCTMLSNDFSGPPSKRTLSWCVARPFHAIYVPDMWFHGTCNLDEHSVGIGYFGGWWNDVHIASANGDISDVKRSLKQHGVGAPFLREAGYTPFVAAAMRGHVSVIQELAKSSKGLWKGQVLTQALVASCFSNSVPTGALLIRLRADPNGIYGGPYDPANKVEVRQRGSTPLSECTRLGSADLLAHLIQARADVNRATVQNAFPLEGVPLVAKAGSHGYRAIVELLVARRVSVNVRDARPGNGGGKTVVQHSISYAYVVEYLLRLRADPFLEDNNGRNAVHDSIDAANCQDRALQSILFAYPMVTDFTPNPNGLRPLHIAARRGHVACSRLLLQHGVPGGKGMEGSPADLAARAGHWAVLQALAIEGGVSTWSQNGSVWKAATRLAAIEGPQAEAWLSTFESQSTKTDVCDILIGTCSL